MSSTPLPVQFFYQELFNNERDRNRASYRDIEVKVIKAKLYPEGKLSFRWVGENTFYHEFSELPSTIQVQIIRTCLSRLNGEPILKVLEGEDKFRAFQNGPLYTSDYLYLTFDEPLRNGQPLNKAIEALHELMLQLVPEYKEFVTNFVDV